MADQKISELTNITGADLADADEFVVVDVSADQTKAVTLGELKEAFDTGSGFVRITGDTMTGNLTVPTADINGGTIDGTVIGGTTPAAVTGTTGQFGTSLNVTGTVTAGGLTVDGGANSELRIDTDAAGYLQVGQFTNGAFIGTSSTNATYGKLRLGAGTKRFIDVGINGDISFYEDTGTTAKFFWDASTERLGIGTAAPTSVTHIVGDTDGTGSGKDAILHVEQQGTWGGGEPWALYVEGYSYLNGFRINANDGVRSLYKTAAGGTLGFATAGADPITFTQSSSTERMRIDSTGKVGIGTVSPSEALSVTGNIAATGAVTANGIIVDNTNPTIKSADADGFLNLSGGTTGSVGTQIRLYGQSHATAANDITFRSGNSAVLIYNASAPVWNFQAEDITTTGTMTATSYTEAVFVITGTTPALDPVNGSIQTWTLTAASTPTSSLSSGESMTLMIEDGTAYSITWPTMTWVNNGGAAPTLATSGKTVVALWNVAGNLYGSFVGNGS